MLDLGCGEGWLARRLSALGVDVVGVDALPALIAAARTTGGGDFRVMSYQDVATGELGLSFDLLVSNFSLLGRQSVDDLIRSAPALLHEHGFLVVQTLHPLAACGDLPYQDGWREGSWAGFDGSFIDPAPWYFRTLTSWIRLFTDSGFRLHELREPIHPHTGRPAAVIFIAQRR
jgi:2-polyprenyl-3-methyl-5-hydroxy-6-metoxy-1,4-benzoquinol methylase